jgi:alcohol dehydrogenase
LRFPGVTEIGWGVFESLKEHVLKMEAKEILLISDDILLELESVKDIVENIMTVANIHVYSDVEAEPTLECAQRLVKYTKEKNVDVVIGLGGGSVLDLAKLAAVLSIHDGTVRDYLNLTGDKKIIARGLPKILVPTTSGTGSEVTNISVLALPGTKDVVAHDYLIADVALVDPALTVSVPPRLTAATGVDALTHAVEAFLSVQANSVTDGLAQKAMQLISGSLKQAVDNGENKEARRDLSEGSYLAGLSFFHAGVAGVHALAYPLGSKFHIPHGESNAVLLPYVLSYISKSCPDKMQQAAALLDPSYHPTKLYERDDYLGLFRQMIEDVNLPTSLKEYGVREEDLEALTADACKQTRLLARSPLPLTKEDIYRIYEMAFEGIRSYEYGPLNRRGNKGVCYRD